MSRKDVAQWNFIKDLEEKKNKLPVVWLDNSPRFERLNYPFNNHKLLASSSIKGDRLEGARCKEGMSQTNCKVKKIWIAQENISYKKSSFIS